MFKPVLKTFCLSRMFYCYISKKALFYLYQKQVKGDTWIR